MPITIKDIARRAGVSHSTVSRALHGSRLISPATALRIQSAASELGYLPSAAARSLKTNRSQALGVIVSSIEDPFFGEILQGIEEAAQAGGYSLFIAASQHDPSSERAIVKTMREHRVDGVILCSTPFSPEHSRELQTFGIPLVVVNNQAAEEYRHSIYHDDLFGSRQVTRHLIDLGHRRIAYLGNDSSGRTNLERLGGFQQEMRAAGLEINQSYLHHTTGGTAQHGLEAARYYLCLAERPTAVFCFNDLQAVGMLRGFHEAGLRVPTDISVAGFDNISISAFTCPPLTTFDQPKRLLGREAARLMLTLLAPPVGEMGGQPTIVSMRGSLLVRESTAKPSAKG